MSESPSPSPILSGAEPWSADGRNGHGALVLHGFTGNPSSLRSLAEELHDSGYSVELPLLPGHGTTVEDMMETGWADWSKAAEAAYDKLSARVDKVVLVGLSMGGTLACWLASRHPEAVGLAVINAQVEIPADSFLELLDGVLESGVEVTPAIGSDIALPGGVENAYEAVPVRPAISFFAGVRETNERLSEIRCPTLIITSRQDHVVPPSSSDILAAAVSGPVERVWLEKSFHVATLDYEADEIEARVVAFASEVTTAV
ncbi:MAG TPA: alpha/beta fold hydrolase [Acidimicrobiales bacterium]|nr:alpha/beta fold hydrolase [Acidimicrobiales bacterium]